MHLKGGHDQDLPRPVGARRPADAAEVVELNDAVGVSPGRPLEDGGPPLPTHTHRTDRPLPQSERGTNDLRVVRAGGGGGGASRGRELDHQLMVVAWLLRDGATGVAPAPRHVHDRGDAHLLIDIVSIPGKWLTVGRGT